MQVQGALLLPFLIHPVLLTEISCPVGFVDEGDGCACGADNCLPFGSNVACSEDKNSSNIRILACLTIDFSNVTATNVVAGYSALAAQHIAEMYSWNIYTKIPSDPADLDAFMCRPIRRTGTLCGECVNGTSINIHSVTYKCILSSHCGGKPRWLLYLVGEYGPLTAFFLAMIFIQPKLVSPGTHAFLITAQLASLPNKLSRLQTGFSAA